MSSASMAKWAWDTLAMGGREFNLRPGHYSRMSFWSKNRYGFLIVPFFRNSEFIWNIVPVGKQ